MKTQKKELAVAALCNGTVIDHIPADVLFEVAHLLQVEKSDCRLTIGNNLPSRSLGRKGIIKVADTTFPEAVMNRIALLAPEANVNVIKNYEVVDKRRVELPDTLVDVVKCNNPKCITNNEPMSTRFIVIDRNPVIIRCHYCGQIRR